MATSLSSLAPAKTIAKFLCLIGLALGLAACGQRGPLKPPSASMPDQGAQTEAPASKQNTDVPDKEFILDPLL